MAAKSDQAASVEIEDEAITCLRAQDSQRFAEALLSPQPPDEALKRAVQLHYEQVDVC